MLEIRPQPQEDGGYIKTFLSEALYAINARPRPAHLPKPEPEFEKLRKSKPDVVLADVMPSTDFAVA